MEIKEIYLVTGAAGHLGFTIVSQLVSENLRVRAFVLPQDSLASKLPPQVEIVRGNVLNKEDIERFMKVEEDMDVYVIHCAAIVSITAKFLRSVYEVNVTGTRNLVDACMEHGVKKLVYISSVHAIPEPPKGVMTKEISVFDKTKVYGMYGKTKAEATQYVMDAAKEGLDVTVIHPSGICGPNAYAGNHVVQMIVDCWKGRLPMGVRGGFDFVDVRDVAAGAIAGCRKGRKGECYILSNRYISVREIFRIFHNLTGKKIPRLTVPMWLAKAVVPFYTLYYKIRKQLPLFSQVSLYMLSSNSLFSNEKARNELGFAVRPFSLTMKDTIDWLKQEHRLI